MFALVRAKFFQPLTKSQTLQFGQTCKASDSYMQISKSFFVVVCIMEVYWTGGLITQFLFTLKIQKTNKCKNSSECACAHTCTHRQCPLTVTMHLTREHQFSPYSRYYLLVSTCAKCLCVASCQLRMRTQKALF